MFQSTSQRSLASSGDLRCGHIPFVILFILFIFGLSAVFLLMMFWHCSMILYACIVFSSSFISLFDVVRITSYGSRSFLSFSWISRCLTRALTVRGVASVFVFATTLAQVFGVSWNVALRSLISASILERLSAVLISLTSFTIFSSCISVCVGGGGGKNSYIDVSNFSICI